jgi:ubiquinone biosynthesis protein
VSPSLRPDLLGRYAQIARVLASHGGRDLVTSSGLSAQLGGELDDDAAGAGSGDDGAPADLARDLESLGPTFIKLGQLLSTRADLLPDAHIEALARLQDDVGAVPFERIREVVEDELGARLSNVFEEFDEDPIASASLGQVHHAVMRDGREVAVKVQRPGIRSVIDRDLEVLHGVASFLDGHTDAGERYHFDEMIDEFERSLGRELDYRREAESLTELRRNLEGFDRLTVPGYVPGLTTSRVLTMDHVDGKKITDVSQLARLDLDGEALVDQLFRAYLQQMLADGFVHADPHPGNVLLTPDHRLALIDVGMVIRLDAGTRERMLRLLLAVADGEGDAAADVALAMGQPTSFFDEEAFRRDVVGAGRQLPRPPARGVARRPDPRRGDPDLRAGRGPPSGRAHAARTHPPRARPGRQGARAGVRRGRGGPAPRDAGPARDDARRADPVVDAARSARHQGAGRAAAGAGEHDPEQPRRGVVPRAGGRGGRRTARSPPCSGSATASPPGLVLAALIVGAAMLGGIETDATILGYPALALVFFVTAAVMGLWLVVSILRSDD